MLMPLPPNPRRVPTRHPAEELLLDYATGAASEGESLMIAAHLALCEPCRAELGRLQELGGAMLDALDPAHLPPGLLNRTLAAIDGFEHDPAPAAQRNADLPDPVAAYIAGRGRSVAWQHRLGRVSATRLTARGAADRVWIMKAPGRRSMLQHRHVGDEWMLVLDGGFTDAGVDHQPGDFAWYAADSTHCPTTAAEGCTCLVLYRAVPRFATLTGRLFGRMLDRG